MGHDYEISDAREALLAALEALDAMAIPTSVRTATDAEEDIIEAARQSWENYLRLVERRFIPHTNSDNQHRPT